MITDLTGEIKEMFCGAGSRSFAVAMVDLPLLRREGREAGGNWPDLFLAPEESLRYAAFRLDKRRDEWLAGRISVKAAVAFIQGRDVFDWPAVTVSAAPSGRPFLASGPCPVFPKINISLSHSRDMAVGLACPHPCGIDIQEIRPAVSRVREKFSTPAEGDLLARSPATAGLGHHARLTLLWAGKEALMKTFDLSPLLFFSEINLRMVDSARKGGIILEFFCERDAGAGPGQCRVWAAIIGNYAFACNLP